MRSQTFDVAVVGGGPAGCAAALALKRKGIARVCIVDPDRCTGPPVGETLPPDTRQLLDQLGLWDGFVGDGHEACFGSCSAWGSNELGYNDFVSNPYACGWHLDRSRFNALLRRGAKSAAVLVLSDAKLLDCRLASQNRFHLHLQASEGVPSIVSARYVVDATGIRSALARRLGARRAFFDCLTFVYGFFAARAGASPSQLTMIEAEEDGWWYAAALPQGHVAVSFAAEPKTVREHMLSVEDRWLARVWRTRHIAARLDQCDFLRGSLVIRAAPSFLLHPGGGTRWLAVGDAAAAYDPLCSQGLHKALEDGLAAADAIAAALVSESDIAPTYTASIADAFEQHRAICHHFYRLERRWAGSPFWQRRIECSAPHGQAPGQSKNQFTVQAKADIFCL